ncbi:hypothetical protein N234_37545 [Ralstonia pickettii DTP0602]|nr:hypothetical protein N234_37545 [Ralstonia pickettii DTP0602]
MGDPTMTTPTTGGSMQPQSTVQVMGIDAGGTMTDTFFVRSDGRFVVGKAHGLAEYANLQTIRSKPLAA